MASVQVTFTGVLYDKYARTTQNVVAIGEASLTGLGVGGGPIEPPVVPPGGGDPPGIWGPTDPRPNPPIAFPPGWVGGVPPNLPPDVTWPPSDAHPEHPIVLPPDAQWPPEPGTLVKWQAVWVPGDGPNSGWQVVGLPQFPHPAPA